MNGKQRFLQCLCERGLTPVEAGRAYETLLHHKLIRINAAMGCVEVKHGAVMEIDVLKRAANESR